jgi:hypothetical protein
MFSDRSLRTQLEMIGLSSKKIEVKNGRFIETEFRSQNSELRMNYDLGSVSEDSYS